MILEGSLGDFCSYGRKMKQITLSSCAHVNLVVKSKIAIKILRAKPFNCTSLIIIIIIMDFI